MKNTPKCVDDEWLNQAAPKCADDKWLNQATPKCVDDKWLNQAIYTTGFVIGSEFIAPYLIEVKISINSNGDLLITDVNNKIMFKVKPCNSTFHEQRILLDADDKPVAMIREKIRSAHRRWNVFRGDSKADSDIIFRTKTPEMIQLSKTNLNVFLANKKTSGKNAACDFKITGSWSERSCTIYTGDSSTILAQMHKIQPSEESRFVNDKFMVTIYPNVDYAFVVTLIAIVEAMKSCEQNPVKAIRAVKAIGGISLTLLEILLD